LIGFRAWTDSIELLLLDPRIYGSQQELRGASGADAARLPTALEPIRCWRETLGESSSADSDECHSHENALRQNQPILSHVAWTALLFALEPDQGSLRDHHAHADVKCARAVSIVASSQLLQGVNVSRSDQVTLLVIVS
jgi:hypothetical protein